MSLNNGLSNMTMPDVEEFLEFYLLDSQEQIERLGASILDLERDSENIGLINELFRSAHSLKGASGTMGFTAIVEVTHAAEDLLDKVRQGKQPVTHEVIDVLLEVTDVVKDMLAQVEAQQPVRHEAPDLVERIRQLAKGKKVEGTEIQPIMKDVNDEPIRRVEFTLDENAIQDLRESTLCGQAIYQITVFLDEEALMKTVRAVMVIQRLQELGKVLAVAPSWEELELMEEEDQQIERFCVLLASDESEGEIASEVFLVSDVADARLDVFDSQEISQLCGIDICAAAQSPISAPSSTPANSRGVAAKTPKETPKKPPDGKAAKKKPSKKKDKAANDQADFEGLGARDLKNAVKTGNFDVRADNFGSTDAGSAGTGSTEAGSAGAGGAGAGSAGAGSAGAGGGEGSGSGGPGDPGGPGDSGGPGGPGGGRISDASNQVHTIRVDTDRMDSLINMVGEMVITRARLVKIGDDLKSKFPSDALVSNLNETNIYLGRLMNDLQESAMRLRMVPVGTVFSRYPRLVRDFCRKTGKKIDLELHGEDTEMDKTVIEQIGDPLTHLIRNCVDHGIEEPKTRIAAGKPEVGKIILKAYHEGNHIAIVISDDGDGLDLQKILRKAVSAGLVGENEELSEREIANLIFLPGFSTADQVTDISGRGVGMDVVKRALSSLGGSVDIRTKAGEGTVFTIRLPLTLAIIQALLVEICGEIYAVPLSSIKETLLVHNSEVRTVGGIKMVKLRGDTLPLLSLKHKFNLPEDEEQENVFVVVVGIADRLIGLMVDELKGQQEIVLKTLGDDLGSLPGISGATILGDGKVTLILDVASLMQDILSY